MTADAGAPLVLPRGESVAAILHTADNHYLMQHRDERPGVELAGYWGLFGGAMEESEAPEEAIRRELGEELAFSPSALSYFTTITTDLRLMGRSIVSKHVFVAPVTRPEVRRMRLGEGSEARLWRFRDLIETRIVPGDAYALLLFDRAAVLRRDLPLAGEAPEP